VLKDLELVLRRYDAGEMSRRDVLGALIAMTLPSGDLSQTAPLIGPATQLNHATLFVESVERSREFYQKLLGMPILTRQGLGVNLRAGAGFLGLYPARDRGVPRIDHVCLSVDRFDAKGVLAKLQALKLDAAISQRGDTEELYVVDPDGISIQIQDTRYRGGVGRLGDRDPG
jgi:catechol 2,3-dioxygenase-like lactoylglutathione lyase family enzyme